MMTREELKEAARALGKASAEVGDMYDIVEAFASGYAETNAEFFKDDRELHYEISTLNELQSVASSVIEWRVQDARKAFMSWDKIGDALDMSRQAAWRKYKQSDDTTDIKNKELLTAENLSIEDKEFLMEANLSIKDFEEYLTTANLSIGSFEEFKHWWFLNAQRIELHNGTLTPERHAYLNEHVPGWDDEPAVLHP